MRPVINFSFIKLSNSRQSFLMQQFILDQVIPLVRDKS